MYAVAAIAWHATISRRAPTTEYDANNDVSRISRWTRYYLAVRLAGYLLWRNELFKGGYTKRSYATSILTQAVLIPLSIAYLARHSTAPFLSDRWFKRRWDGSDGDTSAEREIHALLIGYLLSDVTNLGVSPAFGSSLIMHHVLGCCVPLATMNMPAAIGYSTWNILIMELGSLWFSLADVVGHTTPVLWVRLVWYTLSRVVAVYNTVGIARVLPWRWGAAVCTPAFLLTVNNFMAAQKMLASLLKRRREGNGGKGGRR